MRIEAGRETIKEGKRPRHTRDRLTPAGKPGQGEQQLAPSPSQKSADQSRPMEKSVSRGAREKIKEAVRGRRPHPAWLRRLGYYGLALLFVGVAALLRGALWDVLSPAPTLVFYLAWVGAAAFGGLGPGLLATVASWLCIDLLFDPTRGQIGFSDPMSVARLLILLAGGLIVSAVGEKMRRSRIHEHRQTEELAAANAASRESEERLRQRAEEVETLMDLIPAAIWVAHDPQCNQITGNQAADSFYEAYRQENVSANVSPVRRFFRGGQELKPEELPMQEAAAKDIDIRNSDLDVLLPSGKWLHILGSARPLHDAEGRVRGCLGAAMDITERKQTEQALRERMKELTCLYAVSRDLQEDLSLDELCRRAVEHLVPAMQFPEVTVAVLELKGKRFTSGNYAEGLSHGLHAPIRVEGEVLGHLRVYYAQERPFLIPEEQNLVNGVAEALSTRLVRKRAQEALRESEEKYRRIVETATEGIAMADVNARMVFINDRWSEIFGYSPEEARHVTLLDLVFPEDVAQMIERWESRKRGVKENFEFRFRRKDGRPVWLLVGAAPRLDPEGRFLGTLVMVTDIIKRKQAEEALRAKQAELELILNQTPFMLTRCSRDLHYRYVSRAYAEMIGRTPDQVAGKPILEIMGREGFETIRPHVEAVLRGQPVEYEAPVHFQGVGPHFLHVTYMADKDEQGHVIGWIASIIDITNRKEAEEALRRSERQFKSTFENAAIGIAHVALDGHILQSNGRFCEIAGYSCADVLGRTCEQITFADDWKAEEVQMQGLLDGQVDHYAIEKRYIRRDGALIWVNLTRSIQRDEAGRPEYFIVLVEDISERRRAEEALRDLTAMLESKVAQRTGQLQQRTDQLQKLTLELAETENRERKRMAEILHDDLQQVLAAAKFHLGLMRSRIRQDASLQATAGQIDQMLKDAMEKSRNLSHELSPAVLHQSDFTEILRWLADQMRAKHGLVVRLQVHGPVHLQSDAAKTFLYKTAQELLFNVVKHAQVHEARIEVRQYGRCLCVSVSDRGRGFDPQELREGAGMGLLSIRERIELLGGRMKIKSAAGKGSRFSIGVPNAAGEAKTGSEEGEKVGGSLLSSDVLSF